MITIEWDKRFELGHGRIDAEHRIFLDLIKNVSLLSSSSDNSARIQRTLTEVLKYAEFHFISEENLMQEVGYPDYEKHRNEHSMLLSTLGAEIRKWHGNPAQIDKLVAFLFEWFALHTTQVDKKLAHYIEQHHAAA